MDGDGDGIFGFLGDMIAGALTGGAAAEAVGGEMRLPEAMNPGDEQSRTATYDRMLTGGRRTLNVNDQ